MVGLEWLHFWFVRAAHLLCSKGSWSDVQWPRGFPVLRGTGSAEMDDGGGFVEPVLPPTPWAAPCSSAALLRSLLRVCLKNVCYAKIDFENHWCTWSWSLKWKIVPCPLWCNFWYFLLVIGFFEMFLKSLKFQLYQCWWYSMPVRTCLMAGGLAACLLRLLTGSRRAFHSGVRAEPAASAFAQPSCSIPS